MNQFVVWFYKTDGQRVLMLYDPAHGYDYYYSFYRQVAVLP
jgi:hypothetical protein